MRIALAQLNPTVGDIDGNADRIELVYLKAKENGADIVVTPELSLTGYSLEDFVLRPSFQEDALRKIAELSLLTREGPGLIIGTPWYEGGHLYNAALLIEGGAVTGRVFKHDLPNYGPFDEKRVFVNGPLSEPLAFRGRKLGLMICEDMWTPVVPEHLARAGADLFIVVNASPYETQKFSERQGIARARAMENNVPLVYVNLVGGQDELVFDGGCFIVDNRGDLKFVSERWGEGIFFFDIEEVGNSLVVPRGKIVEAPSHIESVYRTLLMGIRDYAYKNKFREVLIGLSGGIDSALVAVLAVEALGADRVHTFMLPSPYTSQESINDAQAVAHQLGCRYSVIPITTMMGVVSKDLSPYFEGRQADATEENIQARCRGLLLMGLSNKFNYLLLSTSNKSESAVGYATLYGDMCGGYAPLKDVYKTEVYELAHYAVQKNGRVIPERIFTKAPSAELRPNQTDQDSLPPYDVLDSILRGLIERDMSFTGLVEQGHDYQVVRRVWQMLQRAEYKRRQGPPGPKVTRRHLSKDRHYPITNGYSGS